MCASWNGSYDEDTNTYLHNRCHGILVPEFPDQIVFGHKINMAGVRGGRLKIDMANVGEYGEHLRVNDDKKPAEEKKA